MRAHSRRIEAADDLIDALRELPAVVLEAVALGELVCLGVLAERLVVLLDVIEILAERVAQADLVAERQ